MTDRLSHIKKYAIDAIDAIDAVIPKPAKAAVITVKQYAHVGALDLLQRKILFHDPEWLSDVQPIHDPEKYGLGIFKQQPLTAEDGTQFAIWYKPPADKNQPVYVVFHGRAGHWADIGGGYKTMQRGDMDRHSLLKWLKEIAEYGGTSDVKGIPSDKAGIIAVHLRGIGSSARYGGHPTENGFQRDMRAVIDFLRKENITPDRIIATGDSMGGIYATMFAANMNEAGHPPAVLGIANSPISLREAVGHRYKDSIPHELTEKRVVFPLDAREYFARLRPIFHDGRPIAPSPKLCIAHALGDTVAPFDPNHELYMQLAKAIGITPEEIIFTEKDMLEGFSDAHTSVKPDIMLSALRRNYEEYRATHPPLATWPPELSNAEQQRLYKENHKWRDGYRRKSNSARAA